MNAANILESIRSELLELGYNLGVVHGPHPQIDREHVWTAARLRIYSDHTPLIPEEAAFIVTVSICEAAAILTCANIPAAGRAQFDLADPNSIQQLYDHLQACKSSK